MSDPDHVETENKEDNRSEDPQPATGHKQSNWKPLMVAALSAAEQALDGLPIPAAKGCINLVLKVIQAAEVSQISSSVIELISAPPLKLLRWRRTIKTSSRTCRRDTRT